MRGLVRMALAGLLLPVVGGIAALSPRVHVIPFSPASQILSIHVASSRSGDAFTQIVARNKPAVAFNGTFYGVDGKPLGILRSRGKWAFRGGHMRTAFAVDRNGRAILLSRDEVRRNPSRFPFAIAGGPRLLRDGIVCLNPEAEGFRPASRRRRASRTALGIRRDGMAMVVVDEDAVTLAEFAIVCRKAGAVNAVNLDGGSATALYTNGKTLVSPSCPMANVVMISPR